MSNIFDFPPGKRGDGAAPGFLQDSADLVRFDELGDLWPGAEAPGPARGTPDEQSRDWSNQELASIYRVRSLLEAAGVSTVVERGLSDEGDPWCVFCRADGEVFLHLCRIDGRYLLDSPELARPLAGDSFADLVGAFSPGALAGQAGAPPPRGRVVRLDRDDNVLLHPATMLAALVWTILLKSDGLVLVRIDGEEGPLNAEWIAGLADPEIADGAAVLPVEAAGECERSDGGPALPGHEAPRTAPSEVAGGPRETLGKLFLPGPLTGVAAGLSTIALACGFLAEDVDGEAADLAAALPDGEAGSDTGAEEAAASSTPPAEPAGTLAQIDEPAPRGPRPDDTAAADARGPSDGDGAVAASAVTALADLLVPLDGLAPGGPAARPAEAPALSPEQGDAPEIQSAEAGGRLPDTGGTGDAGMPASFADLLSIEDIKTFIHAELRPLHLAGQTFEASFGMAQVSEADGDVLDVALSVMQAEDGAGPGDAQGHDGARGAEAAPPHAMDGAGGASAADPSPGAAPAEASGGVGGSDPDAPPASAKDTVMTAQADPGPRREPGAAADEPAREHARADDDLPLFEGSAREFFYYLRGKTEEVGVIAGDEAIVLVDFGAGPDSVFMKWELSHGGTIATVGSRADYEAFDLIA
jgi:hypothetical protein